MSRLNSTGGFVAVVLLLAALPVAAKPTPPPAQTAVIQNTGSTNTLGYKVTVAGNGSMQIGDATSPLVDGGIPYTGTVKKLNPASVSLLKTQAKKLFVDLDAAMPLTALPVRNGMRSASFGTRTTVTYKGMTSPDLTFASDPRSIALKADIAAITQTLGVGNAPRRPLPPIVIHADR